MAPVAWAQGPPAVSSQEFLIAENMPETTICGEPVSHSTPMICGERRAGNNSSRKCWNGLYVTALDPGKEYTEPRTL